MVITERFTVVAVECEWELVLVKYIFLKRLCVKRFLLRRVVQDSFVPGVCEGAFGGSVGIRCGGVLGRRIRSHSLFVPGKKSTTSHPK